MLYQNLRAFNYLFTLFGLRKPFNDTSSKEWPYNLWSVIIAVIFVSFNAYKLYGYHSFNKYGSSFLINALVLNAISVILDILLRQRYAPELYRCVSHIIKELNIQNTAVSKFTQKIYFSVAVPLMITLLIMIFEIISQYFFVIFIKMFNVLALMHLQIHLSIILGFIKKLNEKLSMKFKLRDMNNIFVKENDSICKEWGIRYYLLSDIAFVQNDQPDENIKLRTLCKIYDSISCCIKLLEKLHGLQMLMELWINFVSGVALLTFLSNYSNIDQTTIVFVFRTIVPLYWNFVLTYLDDQIRQEVEITDTLIMKRIIDFRCDESERNILQSFKQLVSTHRLRFKAVGLFHVDYATIVSNIVSVITYSIILIQLFFSD